MHRTQKKFEKLGNFDQLCVCTVSVQTCFITTEFVQNIGSAVTGGAFGYDAIFTLTLDSSCPVRRTQAAMGTCKPMRGSAQLSVHTGGGWLLLSVLLLSVAL